jgi:hypothetical protein
MLPFGDREICLITHVGDRGKAIIAAGYYGLFIFLFVEVPRVGKRKSWRHHKNSLSDSRAVWPTPPGMLNDLDHNRDTTLV